MEKLKWCPFCGSNFVDVFQTKSIMGSVLYQAECFEKSCKARIRAFKTEEEAIDAWNHRYDDELDGGEWRGTSD